MAPISLLGYATGTGTQITEAVVKESLRLQFQGLMEVLGSRKQTEGPGPSMQKKALCHPSSSFARLAHSKKHRRRCIQAKSGTIKFEVLSQLNSNRATCLVEYEKRKQR